MSHAGIVTTPVTGKGGSFTYSRPSPFQLNDEATLHCDPGYTEPLTTTARVEQRNGQLFWNPPQLHCTSTLNYPPETDNVGRPTSYLVPPYHPGDTFTLECGRGYDPPLLESVATVENGQLVWTPAELKCTLLPAFLDSLPVYPGNEGLWHSDDDQPYAIGAKARLTCSPDFQTPLDNLSEVVEKEGRPVWDPPHIQCLSLLTKEPHAGNFGVFRVGASPYRLGDTAQFECNEGYKLPPGAATSSTVRINSVGKLAWFPDEIICAPVSLLSALPPTGEGGDVTPVKYADSPYHFGDEAQLKCAAGYTPPTDIVSRVVVRNDRLVWHPERLDCHPRHCGEPPKIANGARSLTLFRYPHTLTYVCEEGHVFVGPEGGYACNQYGVWDPPVDDPRCEPVRCPDLTAPRNGTVSLADTTFRSTARYRCDPDFVLLRGDAERRCRSDGRWSGEEVECGAVPCPPMDTTDNAIVESRSAVVECPDGKMVEVKCLPVGKWNLERPYCDEIENSDPLAVRYRDHRNNDPNSTFKLEDGAASEKPENSKPVPETKKPRKKNETFYVWILLVVGLIVIILGWFIQNNIPVRAKVR